MGKSNKKYLEANKRAAQSGPDSSTNGIVQIKRALAGVGNPIKESLCLVSILNFAKRTAENMGMRKGK